MPHWPAQQREAFSQQLWQPTPAMTTNEVAAYRSGWLGEMRQRASDAWVIEFQGFLVLAFWRVEGMMLIGMALFKLGVFSARASARVYWSFVAAAGLIGVPAILYGVYREVASGWDMRDFLLSGQSVQLLGEHSGGAGMGGRDHAGVPVAAEALDRAVGRGGQDGVQQLHPGHGALHIDLLRIRAGLVRQG